MDAFNFCTYIFTIEMYYCIVSTISININHQRFIQNALRLFRNVYIIIEVLQVITIQKNYVRNH